jgi:hypothetical protein
MGAQGSSTGADLCQARDQRDAPVWMLADRAWPSSVQ